MHQLSQNNNTPHPINSNSTTINTAFLRKNHLLSDFLLQRINIQQGVNQSFKHQIPVFQKKTRKMFFISKKRCTFAVLFVRNKMRVKSVLKTAEI